MTRRLPVSRFYQIVPKDGCGWARIWLTDDGTISILSDYGNYGYWFGSPGREFRAFLIGAGEDYITNKLTSGSPEVINEDASVKAVKEHILTCRREGDLDREQARREWDLIKENSNLEDVFQLVGWWEETSFESTLGIMVYQRRSLNAVQEFMKVTWPLFIEELVRERFAEQRELTGCLLAHEVDVTDADVQGFIEW